jgi:hypothetical protein
MSYTRPAHDAADATWLGADAYTRPDADGALATWFTGDALAIAADSGPLRQPQALGDVVTQALMQMPALFGDARPWGVFGSAGYAAAASMLGVAEILGTHTQIGARIVLAPMLGAPALLGKHVRSAVVQLPGILAAEQVIGAHDFTPLMDADQPINYVVDLVTPDGLVRVPVSSWQATLNAGRVGYGQAVIPAAEPYVDDINAATEFVVYRRGTTLAGESIEQEMTRTPAEFVTLSTGPNNYTATIYGYPPEWDPVEDPPTVYDRTLHGVRSMTTYSSGTRVRCAIDWLLRPGQRAYAGETELIVGYINFYVPAGADEYMDVGERVG